MSKFINTKHSSFLQNSVNVQMGNIANNPMYKYNQTKPTKVTYYNINEEKSTLDKALKIEYSSMGVDSPLFFNKINNFYLYGLQRIELNMDNTEFGIEANEISGNCYILPNTIIPLPGDWFSIDYIKEKLLFQIIDVQLDTLDNGANGYNITYKLESIKPEQIEQNVYETYEFMFNNVGTNLKPLIKQSSYKKIENIDNILEKLRNFYIQIFFNKRVQTFTFELNGLNYYDEYLIEFLKRTNILNGDIHGTKYIYIDHATQLEMIFDINYEHSVFKAIELRDKPKLSKANKYPTTELIGDLSSIFTRRYEDYFKLIYNAIDLETPKELLYHINILDDDLVSKIINNIPDINPFKNIIIKYFNNINDYENEIELIQIKAFDLRDCKYFYLLPFVLYILESSCISLLS